ncbi:MAG: choice-of-anchor D domain-containing protein [Bacteroidales bacterium]|nr:choice-of-anchor D domain-containing protein [Bacteroidales bacterium]
MRKFYKLLRELFIVTALCSVLPLTGLSQTVLQEGFETGYNNYAALSAPWSTSESYKWLVLKNSTYDTKRAHSGNWFVYLKKSSTTWMFREVTLEAGKTYKLSLWANQSALAGVNLTAAIGTAANEAAMTTNIIPSTSISRNFKNITGTYTAASDGTYYIGIKGEVPLASEYLVIDDIKLAVQYDNDLAVDKVSVKELVVAGQQTDITATIENAGSTDKTNVDVVFKVNNTVIATKNIASLTAGEKIEVTAPYTVTEGINTVKIELPADDYTGNDSAEGTIKGIPTGTQFMGFEDEAFPPQKWEVVGSDFKRTVVPAEIQEGTGAANIDKFGRYTDAMLITPKVVVNSSSVFAFYAKSADPFNKIQVQYSEDKTNWTTVGDEIILTGEYKLYEIDMSVLDGNYHIALKCNPTSTSNYSYNKLSIDNIYFPELYVSSEPEIALSDAEINFNTIVTNSVVEQTLKITNTGGAQLDITGITVESPFSVTWTGSIAPQATQDIKISVNAPTAGDYTGTITVNSNASTGTNTATVKAKAVDPINMPYNQSFETTVSDWDLGGWSINSNQVAEGTKAIMTYSNSDALISPWIKLNSANPRIAFSAVAPKELKLEITEDGTNYTELWKGTQLAEYDRFIISLKSYANKSVRLRFSSSAMQNYSTTYLDFIVIEDTPSTPIYKCSVVSMDFGVTLLGESKTKSVVISNLGADGLNIKSITIEGTGNGFSLSAITLPAILNANEKLAFDVTFAPAKVGDVTDNLIVTLNDDTKHTYALTGKGFDSELKTLPYSENFDSYEISEMPAGWNKIVNATSSMAEVKLTNAGSYVSSLPNALKLYGAGSTNSDIMAIMPKTKIDYSGTELSFKASGGSIDLGIGYVTDVADASTYTELKSVTLEYAYKDYTVKLPDMTITGDYYLVFKNKSSNTYSSVYIDDVNWAADTKAPEVTFIPANEANDANPVSPITIDFDEAVYNASGNVLADADLADAIIFKATDASGADIAHNATISGQTITLTPDAMLSFATKYYVAVKADIIQDKRGNKIALTEAAFTTIAEPYIATLPFSESFEAELFVPDNWVLAGTKWSRDATEGAVYPDGTAVAKYYAGAYTSTDNGTITTPVIDIESVDNPGLKFHYTTTDITFNVYVSYDLGKTYTEVLNVTENNDWKQKVVVLDTDKKYAIIQFKAANGNYTGKAATVLIDNVKVEDLGSKPEFAVSPSSLDFGTVEMNKSSVQNIVVSNNGGGVLTIKSVELAGDNSSEFALNALTLPADLVGTQLDIKVTFNPVSEGNKSAKVVITESDDTKHEVAITANSVDARIKTLPFAQNFDAVAEMEMPLGWNVVKNNANAYVEIRKDDLANSAPNEVRMYGGMSTEDVILTLPATSLDLTNAKIKFMARGGLSAGLKIGYMTDNTDKSTFTELSVVDITSPVNEQYSASLSGITATGEYYIALKLANPNTFAVVSFDDLKITTNNSPEFTSEPDAITLHCGVEFMYNITTSDADGNDLTITTEYKPDWMTLTDNGDGTAVLKGTHNKAGLYSVSLILDDGEDKVTKNFAVTYTNTKPVFDFTPVASINQFKAYTCNITATDADKDNLVITVEEKPAWLTLTDNGDGTAVIKGTADESGDFTVKLAVTDGFDVVNTQYLITVEANATPVISSIAPTTVTVGEEYKYDITATDADGETLTITAPVKPDWLVLTDNGDGTAVIKGTPSAKGDYNVEISVSDGNQSIKQLFTVAVAALPNNAPEFTSTPVKSVTEDEQYNYNITVTDSDSDAITISATEKPDWLTLTDNGDGTATITGTAGSAGDYNIVISATDSKETVKQSYILTVAAAAGGNLKIISDAVTAATVGTEYIYNISVSGNNNPTITAPVKPEWLTLTDNGDGTAVIKGIPAAKGDYNVKIVVTVGSSSVEQEFVINVTGTTAINDVELIKAIYPNPAKDIVNIELAERSDLFIINAIGNIINSRLNVTGTVQMNIGNLPAGIYFVKVTNNKANRVHRLIVVD